jgi:hypothetical protein
MEVARPDNSTPYPRPFREDDLSDALVATMRSDQAFSDVAAERCRQVMQWGSQDDLSPSHWMTIMMEELGECALCVNEIHRGRQALENLQDLYSELTQLAAVAIAAMQVISLHLDAEDLPRPMGSSADQSYPGADAEIALALADHLVQSKPRDAMTSAEYHLCVLAAAHRLAPEQEPADTDPPPAIPEDAWREVNSPNSYQRKDLSLGFAPTPPLPNIADVRGDVSCCTDGVHCRYGIKVKCHSGHELQLRGGGRNRDDARANLEAAYPQLVAWAAQLAASETDDRQLETGN